MLRSFDWRTAAAKYLFKAMTMEDYLAVYIDALASYRRVCRVTLHVGREPFNYSTVLLCDLQVRSEPLVDLVNLLVRLSKSCPHEDILQVLNGN